MLNQCWKVQSMNDKAKLHLAFGIFPKSIVKVYYPSPDKVVRVEYTFQEYAKADEETCGAFYKRGVVVYALGLSVEDLIFGIENGHIEVL